MERETAAAGSGEVCASAVSAALRALPRVDDVLAEADVAAAMADVPHEVAVGAVRSCLNEERARIRAGEHPLTREGIIAACAARVAYAALPHLRCVVNATGTVIHTNLGRAPLSAKVAAHVADVASHYSTLEFDVEEGVRGSRHDHVRELVCAVTGAEDAAVVNNNAAAVMMVLAEFARGCEVVVSRGELIEIGGSFRIPDIMAMSGAKMVEVGTTNKTHLVDFERAINPETALVLKVHPSNYRVVGFHEEVEVDALARLAHERGVMVYEDQGSGSFVDLAAAGVGSGEHTAAWSLAQGVDLVSFSGDKLLGAAQAGIIVGSSELVRRVKKNPLMRAMRPDKMTLAAIEAVLRSYLDGDAAWRDVPVLAMLGATPYELHERAAALFGRIAGALESQGLPVSYGDPEVSCPEAGEKPCELRVGPACLRVAPLESCVGGGALPTEELPGYGLRLEVEGVSPNRLRTRLLAVRPRAVVARVGDDALLCDVRTLVDERDETDVVEALAGLVSQVAAERSGR